MRTMSQKPSEKRVVSAAALEPGASCEFGSPKYYALCGFGGLLSCGLTHTAVTPLDLVKCRLQVNKEKYKSLGNGFKLTVKESGASGLFLGWAPTAIGYSMQGMLINPLHIWITSYVFQMYFCLIVFQKRVLVVTYFVHQLDVG